MWRRALARPPRSGLNFGGQRARSNAVNVDGMDAVDNSVNGIRSTLSQEACRIPDHYQRL